MCRQVSQHHFDFAAANTPSPPFPFPLKKGTKITPAIITKNKAYPFLAEDGRNGAKHARRIGIVEEQHVAARVEVDLQAVHVYHARVRPKAGT